MKTASSQTMKASSFLITVRTVGFDLALVMGVLIATKHALLSIE